jgi:transportin-3
MIPVAPDMFFQSSAFPLAFRASMSALTLVHTEVIFASLNLFLLIFRHDCLDRSGSVPSPPNFTVYASAIETVMEKNGFQLLGHLLNGLVGDFPEDSTSVVVSIFRAISFLWGSQLLSWLPSVLQQLPASAAPPQATAQFLSDVTR